MSKIRKTHLRDFDPFGETKYHKSILGLMLSLVLPVAICFYANNKISGQYNIITYNIEVQDSKSTIIPKQMAFGILQEQSDGSFKAPTQENLDTYVKFSFAKKIFDSETNTMKIEDLPTVKCENTF